MNNRAMFPSLFPARSTRTLFDNLNAEMARVFNDFEGGGVPATSRGETSSPLTTKMDFSESDDAVEINLEIPGVKEKDVEVELHGQILTISGKRETRHEDEKKDYHLVERQSGSFLRRINLDFNPKPEAVVANIDAGVLTVTIDKPEESKTVKKKISVTPKQNP